MPQWQTINNGNWRGIEEAVRAFAVSYKGGDYDYLRVFSGPSGVLQLEDEDGDMTDIHLYPDETRLRVPLYTWKVLEDVEDRKAVAIVGLNNPHIDDADVDHYKICTPLTGHPIMEGISEPGTDNCSIAYFLLRLTIEHHR